MYKRNRVHLRPNKANRQTKGSCKVNKNANVDSEDDFCSFYQPKPASTRSTVITTESVSTQPVTRQAVSNTTEVQADIAENRIGTSQAAGVPELAPRQRKAPSWAKDYYVNSDLDNVLTQTLQQ